MRSKLIFCLVLGLATALYGKEPKHYQRGKLLQMDSVPCSAAKDAPSLAGDLVASDSGNKTQEGLCQEYVLQAERVIYRIRPKNEKNPVLLPIGEEAQFSLVKERMMLRVEELGDKEREYIVLSISPRSDASSADAAPTRLNHLQ
jgi:hypothetical protein